MNQLYNGIAFRNDNGGLEFYGDDCRRRIAENTEREIAELGERLRQMQDELEDVRVEFLYNGRKAGEWTASLQQKNEEHIAVLEKLKLLTKRAKSGELDETEREIRRRKLWKKSGMLKKEKEKLKRDIRRHEFCRQRTQILPVCIADAMAELADKRQGLEAACTFTVGEPGVLTLPLLRDSKSKGCCVFSDVLDYLAYYYLVNVRKDGSLPRGCDSIVLNDHRNFLRLLVFSDVYDDVYCFFPQTILEKTMELTLIQRHGSGAVSMGHVFEGHATLYEHSCSLDGCSPLNLVRQ